MSWRRPLEPWRFADVTTRNRAQIAMKCQIINTEDVENAVAWLHQLSMDVGGKPSQCVVPACALEPALTLLFRPTSVATR